jgi:alanine-glyoxylate transaminase/serine-glyoxylate transaminase/serine-pyruvate transaminase
MQPRHEVSHGRIYIVAMTLNHGIDTVAIPGPSILPDRVRAALSRQMPNIYAGPLLEASDRVMARLPSIVRTTGNPFLVIGNGHAAWQMAIANTLVPGDKILVLESGRFAAVWGEYARLAGVDVDVLPGRFDGPVDAAALQARLEADDGSIVAVFVAHTDTASSVRNDLPAIRAAIDAAGHTALLMVDGIASIGAERFEMDEWGIDLAIAASQKGLMCPPGISFVWAGPKAVARFHSLPTDRPRVAYLDWEKRLEPTAFYETYAGTPPVAHLHAFDVALELIDEEGGLEAVWRRHEILASGVRAAVAAWAAPGGLSMNITSPEHRSNAVTTVRTGTIDPLDLVARCRDGMGVTLGIGFGEIGGSFRIGHMGHLNPPMILGTLASIEAVLHSLGAPVGGSGVAAAAEVIGDKL